MKTLRRSLLWMMVLAAAASLLLLLPLNAQENSAPTAEPVKNDELPPDERVSADNNLSFPVDI
jgi:hypothetical protein